jgi:hypothetical protein
MSLRACEKGDLIFRIGLRQEHTTVAETLDLASARTSSGGVQIRHGKKMTYFPPSVNKILNLKGNKPLIAVNLPPNLPLSL